jgi:hypothetical protein
VPVPASAANVAELYAVVGRTLKALDNSHGSAATADLWLIYLRIRINDVIADPVKCKDADAVLRGLQEQIARRGEMPRDTERGHASASEHLPGSRAPAP